MSDLDPANIKEVVTSSKPLAEEVKFQITKWIFNMLSPILIIIRVTMIFTLAILANYLIIIVISWSFGSIVSHNFFAAKLLIGIQLLSALGTAMAYILYLIRALFRDLKETRDSIKGDKGKSN